LAPNATIHHVVLQLSDVDRGVYETLDLRVARHPSETMRYMLLRVFAYALSYEDGIAFSKGGLSSTDEAPLSIHDPTGVLLAWIDIGAPSAERLHKAAKAARRVLLFTAATIESLRREAASRPIHKLDAIEVWRLEPAFLDALEPKIEKQTKLELLRSDGHLYVTIGEATIDGPITRASLVE
jgi:uncharacterized protein YaeQ